MMHHATKFPAQESYHNLRITSLKKTRGTFTLFVDKMEIHSPGIYGLIGPNGCGKSTLAKIISGILPQDSGKVETPLDCRDITMITQKPYIMDDTVFSNLAYPLLLRGIKNYKDLCDENLKKAGLFERRKQQARMLSGGEKQKLALLRAMIFNPKLIILDEAMTELDMDSLDMFESMVLQRQKQSPVIWIIISHQLAHIKRLCDSIFFMTDGHIEAEGSVKELINSLNPTVRRYLKHEIFEV